MKEQYMQNPNRSYIVSFRAVIKCRVNGRDWKPAARPSDPFAILDGPPAFRIGRE